MQLSKVKPDLNSIQYFFDENHHFYTSVVVYFSHQQQVLRAHLIFPCGRKGNFSIENIEVFYHEQWNDKKGNMEQYGMALSKHVMVVLLGNNIHEMEQTAKQRLEASFQRFVQSFARKLQELLQDELQFDCEASLDYLSILTRLTINDEVVVGKIATNVYFSNDFDVGILVEQLAERHKGEILNQVKQLEEFQTEIGDDQTVFITTIPIENPVSDESLSRRVLDVTVQSIGYCVRCANEINSRMGTNVKINPLKLEEHLDDLLILIVGKTLQCDQCGQFIKKEKIILWDHQNEQLLREQSIDTLMVLGQMKEQVSIQSLLNAAVEQERYFGERAESFWNAFSYVAIAQWDVYCKELTRFELLAGLRNLSDDVALDTRKEILLNRVERLVNSASDKQTFWRAANEMVIEHYLRLTVFGWDLLKEIEVIGEKRAQFIFQFLPYPEVLKPYFRKHADFFSNDTFTVDEKQQINFEKQQVKLRQLQLENGLLSEKLGKAYARIDELESTTFLVEQENRKPKEILKIQQLKGLIAELKDELRKVSPEEQVVDFTVEEVEFTEVFEEKESVSLDEIFSGRSILLLGGFHPKPIGKECSYKVLSHDARILDPTFYELLKTADVIVVLTRFISHRAMWEAKEFAILDEKEIYYTTFTNVRTILHEVARKKGNK